MDIFEEIERCHFFKDIDSNGYVVRVVGIKRKDTRRHTQFYGAVNGNTAHELVGIVRSSNKYSGVDDDYYKEPMSVALESAIADKSDQ